MKLRAELATPRPPGLANAALEASLFAPVFGSEQAFTDALRAHVMSTLAGAMPRRDLVPFILANANDDELASLLIAGERPQRGGYTL